MTPVALSDVTYIGQGLSRPECIVATAGGEVFASDSRGGIARLRGDDEPELIMASGADLPEGFLPNGFALMPDGSFLIANLGPAGGVYRMSRRGEVEPFLLEIEGRTLPSTNFVNRDASGRVWISISTWLEPRDRAFQKGHADGLIALVDDGVARVVADSIGYTNENKLDPSGQWLYVNETIARRLIRFPVGADGTLGTREIVTEFGPGTVDGIFPDGLDFDAEGGVWIASVASNRVVRVSASGQQQVILDGGDPASIATAEANFAASRFTREDLDAGRELPLRNLASVTFGGPDLSTVYLGSLYGEQIATFRSSVAGAAPPHWLF